MESSFQKIFSIVMCERKHGSIIHLATEKCLIPNAPGRKIRLTADCSLPDTIFILTSRGSLLHGASVDCVHPQSGWSRPDEHSYISVHGSCDASRLTFYQITKEMPLNKGKGTRLHL